jgi:hypothetical protein
MRDKLNLVTALSGVAAIVVIEVLMNSLDTTDWNPAMVSIVTTLCPIIISISVILGVFKYFAGEEDTGERRIVRIIRYKKWDAFGNRMKLAYSAKFGGKNPAFNNAVDQHILAVKVLGKGYTKNINMQWLKRMAKFVEIPWAIPEEERLTEVEKTNSFSGYATPF